MSSENYIHAYYDLRVAPLSFDFLTYLCILSITRFNLGSLPVVLTIIRSQYRKTNSIELGYEPGYEDRKLFNVLISLVSLSFVRDYYIEDRCGLRTSGHVFPAEYDPSKIKGVSPLSLMPVTIRELSELYNYNQNRDFLNCINPTDKSNALAKRLGNYVTLTLRYTPHNSVRNCDLSLFYELYVCLLKEFPAIKIIVIPDQDDFFSEKAFMRFNWTTSTEAALDLDIRLGLYRNAITNISWTGGLGSMLYLSDNNYLLFGLHNEGHVVSSKSFFERKGPAYGLQLPWSKGEQQTIDWKHAPEVDLEHLISISKRHIKAVF